MSTELNTAKAPTERSIPAVRITRLCATPRMPTTAICCMISVSVPVRKNRSSRTPNTMSDATNTIIGTSDGVPCRMC